MRVKIPIIAAEPRGATVRNIVGRRARANRGLAAAIAVKYQRFRVLDAATGIRIKMGAPMRRPLSAVPRIESVIMLTTRNAMVPMVIDVVVIEADVIVVIMVVAPSPSKRAPPWIGPGSKPESVAESEAKAHIPIVGETRAESIGAGTAYPIASDIRRVVPARAVNHHVIWTDLSTKVTRCIADVHIIGRGPIDLRVSYIMERRADRNAVNDRRHIRRDLPRSIGRRGIEPNPVFYAIKAVAVHFDHWRSCVHRVLERRASNGFEGGGAVVGNVELCFVPLHRGRLGNRVGNDCFVCLRSFGDGDQHISFRMGRRNLRKVTRQLFVRDELPGSYNCS